MKSPKIEFLSQQLEKQTGINFQKYANPELIEQITNIVTFPVYAVKNLKQPIKITYLILLILAVFFIVKGNTFFGIVLIILGIPIGFFNGVWWGLVNLIKLLKNDMMNIIDLMLNLTETVMADFRTLKSTDVANKFKIPKTSEIINGIIFIVILPVISKIIRNKMPFLGTTISSTINKTLGIVANLIGKEESEDKTLVATAELYNPSIVDNHFNKSIAFIKSVQKKINTFTNTSIEMASFPIRMIAMIISLVSILILTGLYVLLT
jgi:hypothetical protein